MTDPTMPPAGPTPPASSVAPLPEYQPGQVVRTNTLAVVALILGILVPPGGIICGHIALSQIRRTHEQGHGMALAGTIVGYVLTALILLIIAAYIIFFIAILSAVGSAAGHLPTDLPSGFPS